MKRRFTCLMRGRGVRAYPQGRGFMVSYTNLRNECILVALLWFLRGCRIISVTCVGTIISVRNFSGSGIWMGIVASSLFCWRWLMTWRCCACGNSGGMIRLVILSTQ